MKTIRIIAGSYGHKPEGSGSVTLITRQHPPIQVSDAEAERLVGLCVAAIIETDVAIPAPEKAPAPQAQEGTKAQERETAKPLGYSIRTSARELTQLLEEYGLPFEEGMTKRQMVEQLDYHFAGDDVVQDQEGAPDLKAGAVIL